MPRHWYVAGKHTYRWKDLKSFTKSCLHGCRFVNMPPKQKKLEESGMIPESAGKENGKRTGRLRMQSLIALTLL